MKRKIYGKKKLVLSVVVCASIVAVAFSSVMAAPPPGKVPNDDDWNTWDSSPDMFSYPVGNVGIGTTTPSEKLDVNGNIAVSGTVDGRDISEDGTKLDTVYGWGDHSMAGYMTSYSETDPTVLASVKDGVDWSELSGIPGDIADGDQVGVVSESDPVFVASPAHGITGTDIADWNTAFGWGNHATSGYDTTQDSWTGTGNVYTTSGDVGIGISSPAEKLHIYDGEPEILIEDIYGLKTFLRSQAGGGVIGTKSNNNFYIQTYGNYRMSFDTFGNVGIGTTSPSGRLQVVGDEVRIGDAGSVNYVDGDGDLYVEDELEVDGIAYLSNIQDGGYYLRLGNTPWSMYANGHIATLGGIHVGGASDPGNDNLIVDGNVGIGTTSPSHKLEVAGNVHVGGDLTWTTKTSYVSVSAAAFRPRDNSYLFTNTGSKITNDNGISDFYYAPVQLPHYATVTNLTFYWEDTSVIDGWVALVRNSMGGSTYTINYV